MFIIEVQGKWKFLAFFVFRQGYNEGYFIVQISNIFYWIENFSRKKMISGFWHLERKNMNEN